MTEERYYHLDSKLVVLQLALQYEVDPSHRPLRYDRIDLLYDMQRYIEQARQCLNAFWAVHKFMYEPTTPPGLSGLSEGLDPGEFVS